MGGTVGLATAGKEVAQVPVSRLTGVTYLVF